MIGFSQVQFPRSDYSKVGTALYLSFYYALTIATIPTSIAVTLVPTLYDAEIKTFLGYKKIKGGEKISKKEYWKIFGQGNIIKSIAVSCIAGLTIYYFFSKSLILAWLLAPIPLAVGVVLLQPETRPAKLNPIALLKASLKLLSDGLYENLIGSKNLINAVKEHIMPHMENNSIVDSINTLKGKYGKKIPEPNGIIRNDEFVEFIKYIEGKKEFGNNNKRELISFFKEWCNDDKQVHVSGLTGGQILYLVLKACNSEGDESIAAKRQELVRSLMYAMNYAKGTVIPETCFTGIIGAMLKSLEGIHPGIRVKYLLEDRIGICAEDEACEFIKKELQKKKNHKEILNAWGKSDDSSNQITSHFIQEIRIPLMRNLFSLNCSEQAVLRLMEDIGYMKLNMLEDSLLDHIRNKLKENSLGNQKSLLENIGEKVFLELLNRDLLKTDFSLKSSSISEAKRIADTIIEEEVKGFKLKAEKTIEGQVVRMLDELKLLPQEKKLYRVYSELSRNNENDKEKIKKILQERLAITKAVIDEMLKKETSCKLELEIEDVYNQNKNNMTTFYKKIKEAKQGFIEDGLLTPQEVENITKVKVVDLNKKDKIMPSSNLSRSSSVSDLTLHHL